MVSQRHRHKLVSAMVVFLAAPLDQFIRPLENVTGVGLDGIVAPVLDSDFIDLFFRNIRPNIVRTIGREATFHFPSNVDCIGAED